MHLHTSRSASKPRYLASDMGATSPSCDVVPDEQTDVLDFVSGSFQFSPIQDAHVVGCKFMHVKRPYIKSRLSST
jgi:hypothetical protein